MHIYIEEICETFRKKFTSRLCENPPVKSNQNYIQPHPKLNKAHLILWDSRFNTNIGIVGHSQPKK